jgi:hypothetical protein
MAWTWDSKFEIQILCYFMNLNSWNLGMAIHTACCCQRALREDAACCGAANDDPELGNTSKL